MGFNKNLLTGVILLASGTYKTFSDYKKTPEKQKNRTLLKNVAVLGAATLSVFTTDYYLTKKFNGRTFQNYFSQISEKILNNKFFRKIMSEKTIKHFTSASVGEIISGCAKDCLIAITATIAGLGGGFISDKILEKYKPKKKSEASSKYQKQYTQISNSFNQVMNSEVIDKVANNKSKSIIMNATKVFNAAGFFPNPFDNTGTILNTYELSKEKNLKKIMEKTSVGILANSLIPTFCLTFTNSMIKNKSMYFKLPALACSFFIGDIVGKKITKSLIKEIPQTETDIQKN